MEYSKLKFNQFLETNIEQTKTEKTRNISGKRKLKIKSIVPVNFPIKVLKGNKYIPNNHVNENNDSIFIERNEIEKKQCHVYNTNEKIDCNKNTFGSQTFFVSEVYKPLIHAEPTKLGVVLKPENQNIKSENDKKSKDLSQVKICSDKLKSKNCYNSQNSLDILNRIKKINNKSDHKYKKNISHITCEDNDKNKNVEIIEIINIPTKPVFVQNIEENKVIHNTDCNKSKVNVKYTYEKMDICNKWNKDRKFQNEKENILKKTTNVSSELHENRIKKCMQLQKESKILQSTKLKKVLSSNDKNVQKLEEKSPFHIDENNCNFLVKSGTLMKNKCVNKNNNLIKINERRNIISEDLLLHPEYNSTICIMKKLKDIEKQKLIIDFEHLPTCKKIFHDQVLTALDFAPYESIYKDLINLSVDDHNFSFKLIRSKYLEPKNKDIIPKISHFYNPKYTEQYFAIINSIISNPINTESLSPCTVSNKICMWKMSRNKF